MSIAKIARYRELGQRSALQLRNKELGEFFQRAEAEGCKIVSYPFNLQGKEWGFFHAPYTQYLDGGDIAFVAFPSTAACPISPAPVMGLKQCVAGRTCRAPCIT